MNTYKIYNIDWDTDGEIVKRLPVEIVALFNDTCDIEDTISEWLSDNFCYCHNGFDFEAIN